MRSVNILMTQEIAGKLEKGDPESRSAAVRDVAAVLLEAYNKGHEWIVGEIKDRVDSTSPRSRREDEQRGVKWDKAIVWVPENMYREIDRLGEPNNIKVSEFLRGAVIFATDSAKNETD
jgi:hypothetical protein